MNLRIKCATTLCLIMITTSAMAAKVNPYNYSNFKNAINDSKWQRGSNSNDQCYNTGCKSTMNSTSNQKYLWADNSNKQMFFSTNGTKSAKWRNELRFEGNFSRGSKRTFTAKLAYQANKSTSKGFTVAQLHMETTSKYKVKGAVARLEIVNEKKFKVVWRKSYSCTSNCWSSKTFSANTSGWKSIKLKTSGNKITISVNNQSFTYTMNASGRNWPSDGKYHWKTGVYLQKSGTAYITYKDIKW